MILKEHGVWNMRLVGHVAQIRILWPHTSKGAFKWNSPSERELIKKEVSLDESEAEIPARTNQEKDSAYKDSHTGHRPTR